MLNERLEVIGTMKRELRGTKRALKTPRVADKLIAIRFECLNEKREIGWQSTLNTRTPQSADGAELPKSDRVRREALVEVFEHILL
jgi:hypothetical protein